MVYFDMNSVFTDKVTKSVHVTPTYAYFIRKSQMIRNKISKAGKSRGQAPGQASDYALRAPNPLDSSTMTRCFIKISDSPNQSGPQVFCPPAPLSRQP